MEAGRESRRVSGEVAAYSDARTRPSRGEMSYSNGTSTARRTALRYAILVVGDAHGWRRLLAKVLPLDQPLREDAAILDTDGNGGRRAVVKENEHLAVSRSFETPRSKIEDCCDLFSRQVEPFHDVFYAGSCFEIFEDRSHRHSRATEDPGTAYLSWYALDRGALRPIKR